MVKTYLGVSRPTLDDTKHIIMHERVKTDERRKVKRITGFTVKEIGVNMIPCWRMSKTA